MLALCLIDLSTSEVYGPTVVDPRKGDLIREHINIKWIQQFMQANNIICRYQTGKLQVSEAKQELIERNGSKHLGELFREFNSGELDENCVFNSDETHFVFDFYNHKTFAMKGDQDVKYADVISGDEGMTMMVTLSGGGNSRLSPAFLIFKNPNRSYPIGGGVPEMLLAWHIVLDRRDGWTVQCLYSG